MKFTATEFMPANLIDLRQKWAMRAEALKPKLQHKKVFPKSFVRIVPDDGAYQGIRAVPDGSAENPVVRTWKKHTSFMLDFGEHHVGYFEFEMHIDDGYCDSPVSLRLMAAELPYELAYRKEDFRGGLSQGWIQEEYIKIDVLPGTIRLPRRYVCRYLRIDVLATPGKLVFDQIGFDTVSVENYLPETPVNLTSFEKEIYTVGCRTLRDCMQTCFEDGPKRDRRLWLGDLYLQAKVNAVSYRNSTLVERSVYLLAANMDDAGMFPACAFEHDGMKTQCFIPDYAMLFPALLLDHYEAYGNRAFAEEFYSAAVQQLRLFRLMMQDDNCHLTNGKNYWFFVDHCANLEKETAEICIYLFSLQKIAKLAQMLGHPDDGQFFLQEYEYWREIVRRNALNQASGLVVSGDSKQVSEASQIWAVLSGVLTPAEGKRALAKMKNLSETIHSHNPYLYHYLLEAYELCGEPEKAVALIHDYWGGMIRLGADTFWEIFEPDNLKQELYNDACLISSCHAWSCTPCLFLRRKSDTN